MIQIVFGFISILEMKENRIYSMKYSVLKAMLMDLEAS